MNVKELSASAEAIIIDQQLLKAGTIPKDEIIKSSYHWHMIIVNNVVKHTKDYIFESIMKVIDPHELIPTFYTTYDNCISFLVQLSAGAILNLLSSNLMIIHKDNYKDTEPFNIKIVLKFAKPTHVSVDYKSIMMPVLEKRYNEKLRLLNLKSFHEEPDINDYFPLWVPKVLSIVLTFAKDMEIETLILSNNRLVSLKPLELLKRVICLDLRQNKINDIDQLLVLKPYYIKELILEDNPICAFMTKFKYVNTIKTYCPHIEKLDGISIPPDSHLCPQRNYLCNPTGKNLIDQFLEHYFTLYDSYDRSILSDSYHYSAMMSMTNNILSQSTVETFSKIRYNTFSRNLQLSNVNNLFVGPDDILRTLVALSMTIHDPLTFTVDMIYATERTVVFTVSGVFKETQDNLVEEEVSFNFNRTFVLMHIGNDEYKIVNEQFHISSATVQQLSEAFSNLRISNMTIINIPEAYSENEKEKMLIGFMNLTDLKEVWAKKCLEECRYNMRYAIDLFKNFVETDRIPSTAFRSSSESVNDVRIISTNTTRVRLVLPVESDLPADNSPQPLPPKDIVRQIPPTKKAFAKTFTPLQNQEVLKKVSPQPMQKVTRFIPPNQKTNTTFTPQPNSQLPSQSNQQSSTISISNEVRDILKKFNAQPATTETKANASNDFQQNLASILTKYNAQMSLPEVSSSNSQGKSAKKMKTPSAAASAKPNEPAKSVNVKQLPVAVAASVYKQPEMKTSDSIFEEIVSFPRNMGSSEVKAKLTEAVDFIFTKYPNNLKYHRLVAKQFYKNKMPSGAREMLRRAENTLPKSIFQVLHSSFIAMEVANSELKNAEAMIIYAADQYPIGITTKLLSEVTCKVNVHFTRKMFNILVEKDLPSESKRKVLKAYGMMESIYGDKQLQAKVRLMVDQIAKSPIYGTADLSADPPAEITQQKTNNITINIEINKNKAKSIIGHIEAEKRPSPAPAPPPQQKSDAKSEVTIEISDDEKCEEGAGAVKIGINNNNRLQWDGINIKSTQFKAFRTKLLIEAGIFPKKNSTLFKDFFAKQGAEKLGISMKLLEDNPENAYVYTIVCAYLWDNKRFKDVIEALEKTKHKNLDTVRNTFKIRDLVRRKIFAKGITYLMDCMNKSSLKECITLIENIMRKEEDFAKFALASMARNQELCLERRVLVTLLYKTYATFYGNEIIEQEANRYMLENNQNRDFFHPDDTLSNPICLAFRKVYTGVPKGAFKWVTIVDFINKNFKNFEGMTEGTRALYYHNHKDTLNTQKERIWGVLTEAQKTKYMIAVSFYETFYNEASHGVASLLRINQADRNTFNVRCAFITCNIKMNQIEGARSAFQPVLQSFQELLNPHIQEGLFKYYNDWLMSFNIDLLNIYNNNRQID